MGRRLQYAALLGLFGTFLGRLQLIWLLLPVIAVLLAERRHKDAAS